MFHNVKIIKYIMTGFLLALLAVLPGELFQGYLDQYNDFWRTTFYMQPRISGEQMKKDLSETAEKHGVHIFKICNEDFNNHSTAIDIYADDEVFRILSEEYGIAGGAYRSFFSGTTTISCHRFAEIPEEVLEKHAVYYLYGDEDAMFRFKEELSDVYAGNFPRNDGFNALKSYRGILLAAWIFAIAAVGLLSVYDAVNRRKGDFLRFTFGEPAWLILAENLLADTGCFLFLYAAFRTVMQRVQGSLAFGKYSDLMFLILLAVNAAALIFLSKTDTKSALADSTGNAKILTWNYVVSAICILVLVVSLASCVELLSTSYDYYRQRGYFEARKEYSWYQRILLKEDDPWEEPEDEADGIENTHARLQGYLNEFLSQNAEKFFYLCQGREIRGETGECFYDASSGTREYLQSKIPELNRTLDADVYILANRKTKFSDEELRTLATDWADTENYEVIYYAKPIDIVYRDFEPEPITKLAHNPVILFHTEDLFDAGGGVSTYEFFLGMLDDTSGNWKRFAEEKGISYVETGAWDYYGYRWTSLSRTMVINLVIVAIMVFMYVLVACMIIRMEFKINAKELVLKKICGYPMFERFGRIYYVTTAIAAACVLACAVMRLLHVDLHLKAISAGVVLIVAVQYCFITWQITVYEKKNMQSILKGCGE